MRWPCASRARWLALAAQNRVFRGALKVKWAFHSMLVRWSALGNCKPKVPKLSCAGALLVGWRSKHSATGNQNARNSFSTVALMK